MRGSIVPIKYVFPYDKTPKILRSKTLGKKKSVPQKILRHWLRPDWTISCIQTPSGGEKSRNEITHMSCILQVFKV